MRRVRLAALFLLGAVLVFWSEPTSSAEAALLVIPGSGGDVAGGTEVEWYTHLGFVQMRGVRQKGEALEIEWRTASAPQRVPAGQITFAWAGATGGWASSAGNFTLLVNGHEVADFDVVIKPTRFPAKAPRCELLYDVVWVHTNEADSSGYFFVTVPADWVEAGKPATIRVVAKNVGLDRWYGLLDDAKVPAVVPERQWATFVRACRADEPQPAEPPPPATEASYEWYLKQYADPGILTTIGPPGDPCQTAVSPCGQLFYGRDIYHAHRGGDWRIAGTNPPDVMNGLGFALFEDGNVVPLGADEAVHQSLLGGCLPIVVSTWRHRGIEVRETAFAQPFDGDEYRTGKERTLAWAGLELTNRAEAARDVTLLAFHTGDAKNPKWGMTGRDGAVLYKDSALFAGQAPSGFKLEFAPVYPSSLQREAESNALGLLQSRRAVYNALVVKGRLNPGETKRFVFNRVFDFPGTMYVEPEPGPPVEPKELTSRSYDKALESARTGWSKLAREAPRFQTPDPAVNNIYRKAALDGYFLTKRWDGRYVVFDSIPNHYLCQWDDASMAWVNTLDLVGDHGTAERLLDTVFERQGQRKPNGTRTHEGCFSDVTNTAQDGSSASWASCNGWALWAMAGHARLTGDRAWLSTHKEKILDGCEWIIRERGFSRETKDNPCAGLIYGRFVCDSGDACGYYTYTDAISYMGLFQMARLLDEWGHPEGSRLLVEAEAYRRDIVAAVDRLTDKSRDPWYVPWMLSAPDNVNRYLYDIVGPINLATAGVVSRDDERISHIMRWILEQTHRGSLESYAIGVSSPSEGSIFYAEELAQVLLEQGRVPDFLRIFYTLLASDISHETLTTCEWKGNTQPHVHSISALVHMLRMMLVQERDGALYLLQGVPRTWLEQGKEIVIRDAPTWYGPISLRCTSAVDEGRVTISLKVPERIGQTPIRLRIRAPHGRHLAAATVKGRGGATVEKDWIVLTGASGEVSIEGTLQTDLERIKALLSRNEPTRWVFAGDSITSAVLYTFGERDYVQIFEERLRWELQRDRHIVIKSAVSGWNTEALKNNIEWNVLKFDPDVVSIMMGMNDAGFVTIEQFKTNYNAILDQIAERTDAAVILHTPNPLAPGLSDRGAAVAAVAQAVREIGAERGLPVVDQYAAYEQAWKENGRRVFVWMADGVHPGTIGHRVFAREMMKVLGIWDETSETGKLSIY